jgi:hypothetical protein
MTARTYRVPKYLGLWAPSTVQRLDYTLSTESQYISLQQNFLKLKRFAELGMMLAIYP